METGRKGKYNPQTVLQAHSVSREACEATGASSGTDCQQVWFCYIFCVLELGSSARCSYTGIQVCLELRKWGVLIVWMIKTLS